MAVAAIIGAAASLAAAGYSAYKQNKSAEEQEKELARQQAQNEAWYNRNYYQDYLNTVEAQNAIKQYRNAWAERTREARARQAITGGTPEQAQAVAEAGGEAMGNMMGNLAAQGERNKSAIDAQKLTMDNNLSQQRSAVAAQKEQAAANMMQNSMNVLSSSLQSVDAKPKSDIAPAGELIEAPKVSTPADSSKPVTENTELEIPKNAEPLKAPGMMGARVGDMTPPTVAEPGIIVPKSDERYDQATARAGIATKPVEEDVLRVDNKTYKKNLY